MADESLAPHWRMTYTSRYWYISARYSSSDTPPALASSSTTKSAPPFSHRSLTPPSCDARTLPCPPSLRSSRRLPRRRSSPSRGTVSGIPSARNALLEQDGASSYLIASPRRPIARSSIQSDRTVSLPSKLIRHPCRPRAVGERRRSLLRQTSISSLKISPFPDRLRPSRRTCLIALVGPQAAAIAG